MDVADSHEFLYTHVKNLRRKLILVARDTPFSLIHLNNMKLVTKAGGIICPAVPSFYSKPATIEELAQTVVSRVIDLMGLENESYRWAGDGHGV
ncbi:MAG: hypothetical protein EOP49_41125, partial [Sphingobacteriales bacterium]